MGYQFKKNNKLFILQNIIQCGGYLSQKACTCGAHWSLTLTSESFLLFYLPPIICRNGSSPTIDSL